jgi:ABC-2 type transport system ATP-binding protein
VTLDRGPDEVRQLFGALDGVTDVTHLGDDGLRRRYALSAVDPVGIAPRVASDLAEQGWALYGLEQERRDLEALFGAVSGGSGGLERAGADAEEAAHV